MKETRNAMLSVIFFISLLVLTNAFVHMPAVLQRSAKLRMATLTVDGTKIEAPSKQPIRKIMLDNKKDVYTMTGKLQNCGGGGVCGLCTVKVLDGMNNLTPASKNEVKVLGERKKGADVRLGCCAKMTGKGDVKIKSKA